MRALARTGWAILMLVLFAFIWSTFFFKDDVSTGSLLEFYTARGYITFSKPFSLEAGSCDYFILTSPQGNSLQASHVPKPLGVDCLGKWYFQVSDKIASAGKWAIELGNAQIRATSLDDSPIVATVPNHDMLDVTLILFMIFGIFVGTLLFVGATDELDDELPAWLRPKQKPSSSRN